MRKAFSWLCLKNCKENWFVSEISLTSLKAAHFRRDSGTRPLEPSSSSSRSSSILRWVVLPQDVTGVYHSQVRFLSTVWLGRFFFKQFLAFFNSQVKASSSSSSRSLSTLRLGVLLYTVGGSSWSSSMNLSSLKSGLLPRAVLGDYLLSGEGLSLKLFQEIIYSQVRDYPSSCSRRLSTLRWGIISQAVPGVCHLSVSSSSCSRRFGILCQTVPGVCLLSGSFSSMSRNLSTLRLCILLQAVPGVYLVLGRFQYLIYSQVRRKNSLK